jgi:hypothetical protein
MFHACNTNISLTKILLRESWTIHTQFINDSAQIMRDFPCNIGRAQPRIRSLWVFACLYAAVHVLLVIYA